jgi:hypothetical protein
MTYLPRYEGNKIHDVQFDETGATEIMTLTELKAHLQITYTDDDTYLTALIKACRQAVERFCNISLVAKTVTLIGDFHCEFELPYGPVSAFTSASLKTGTGTYTAQTVNTDYEVDGLANGFQIFKPFISGRWKLVYAAGFASLSTMQDIVLDNKRICGHCYENKGDQPLTSLQGGQQRPKGLDEALELFATKHRRMQYI